MTQPNPPFLAMLVDTPAGQRGEWVSFSARSSILVDQGSGNRPDARSSAANPARPESARTRTTPQR